MSSDEGCAEPELPAVDDHLAVPETRYEIIEGRVVYVSPAKRPHATRQSKLAALLEAHTALEYAVATEMLTRTSKHNDFAPDVSVFPREPDPVTGGRQLEHLAFEVVSTQTLRSAAYKADQLVGRGVRRVFAVDVVRGCALEWSRASGKWEELDAAGEIEDLALNVALPVKELITTARSDDAVARALYLKGNPYLLERVAEGEAKGHVEGEAKGRAEGEAKGRAEGEAKGRAEGEAKGRAEGEAKGRAEGEAKGRAEGEAKGRAEGEAKGRAEGEAKGHAEGEAKGRAEGEAKGRAEGEAKGRAEALMVVLDGRGLAIDEATRARLLSERDTQRLDRWLSRAMTCATIDELDLET